MFTFLKFHAFFLVSVLLEVASDGVLAETTVKYAPELDPNDLGCSSEDEQMMQMTLLQSSLTLGRSSQQSGHTSSKEEIITMHTRTPELSLTETKTSVMHFEWIVLLPYMIIYIVSICVIKHGMTCVSSDPFLKLVDSVKDDTDVETRSWRKGFLRWISVSWATPWCARWGHSLDSAFTRIRPSDLPKLGRSSEHAQLSAEHFETLWNEDVKEYGLEKASLERVVRKMWSMGEMLALPLLLGVEFLLGQLYSVFLVQTALVSFHNLQVWYTQHPSDELDMTWEISIAIVAFTLPAALDICLATAANSISCRLDQRLCGALAVSLFKKAQRLPLTSEPSMQCPKSIDSCTEVVIKSNADLQTLLNYDLFTALQGSYYSLCQAMAATSSIVILLVLMAIQLRLATFCAIGFAIPFVIIGVVMGTEVGQRMTNLQQKTDKRIVSLREVLFGVRVIKCYGWEDAMEKKLAELRKHEISALKSYYSMVGALMCVFAAFPRLMVIAGLWAFSAIYGQHEVATIFTSLQILTCLRGACEVLANSLARVAAIAPSLSRVETYLKLPEAPLLTNNISRPTWIKEWPEKCLEATAEVNARTQFEDFVQIRGSFTWDTSESKHDRLALSAVDVRIAAGELVAVVGGVGSGKSALLQALLGELTPNGNDALICRPKLVAYCPQVPHIAEGSLKENILFGQVEDVSRYKEAVEAAGLVNDLKVLAGGDQVLIGARGIALSGGQKARVSMARAAYHLSSKLVVMDDPFGALDMPTAELVFAKLLQGPLMEGRTCVVALQPDLQNMLKFHRIVLMSEGKVLAQGCPEEVMATEAFQQLLSSQTDSSKSNVHCMEGSQKLSLGRSMNDMERTTKSQLRDDEFEGRPSFQLVIDYGKVGRIRNILAALIFFIMLIYVYLLCDLVLANWTNELAINPNVDSFYYLRSYVLWIFASVAVFGVAWSYGQEFTLRLSANVFNSAMHSLLRAPIDRFFDKQPVGRLLNRLHGDLISVDLTLYGKTVQMVVITFAAIIPLLYVHTIMPMIVTLMSIPLYFLIFQIYVRYRNTSVPMRYCFVSSKSEMNSIAADVMAGSTVIRAYGHGAVISEQMCRAVDDTLKVMFFGDRHLRRWLANRVIFLWSFFTSTTYVVALLYPQKLGAGTLGICITNLLLMQALIESNIDSCIGALFELIALARIHEYVEAPQEKFLSGSDDANFRNFTVRFPRRALADLHTVEQDRVVQVLRGQRLLLQSTPDLKYLTVPSLKLSSEKGNHVHGPALYELCLASPDLRLAEKRHRIAGVNDIVVDSKAMAMELCGVSNNWDSSEIILDLRSGWLEGGAKLQLENIRAGYADNPRNVLQSINLSFDAKSKNGICGTTGCGKSTLLLVILRVLEPRAGRVIINDVDISSLGLSTLRSSLGLVPQDPILFTGSLRHNLDPLNYYTDGRIMAALRCAHLDKYIQALPGELDYQINDEGNNLSFGQRQLLCLARMILRQPALLLLDEATSAIDPRTQQTVQSTISSSFPDSTLIAIAHRLETILDFDRIVVLDNGHVVEQGSPSELRLRPEGRFHQMLSARQT